MKQLLEPQFQCDHCGRIGTESVIEYCEAMHVKKIEMLDSLVVGADVFNPYLKLKGKILELHSNNIVVIRYNDGQLPSDLNTVRYTRDTVYSWISKNIDDKEV